MKYKVVPGSQRGEILLGAHMSIAGGLERSIHRIKRVGGTALQIFTKNQRQWASPVLSEEQIEKFLREKGKWGPYPIFSHTSYLINLASPDREIWRRSLEDLKGELCRAISLKLTGVVTHPGSHRGEGISSGIARIKEAIDIAIEDSGFTGIFLLETTCGQGAMVGGRFEELAEIISGSKFRQSLYVCVDTAHIFAAGYDIKREYEQVIEEIESVVGIDNVGLFHLNDNEFPLSSKKDKHTHIGGGEIGIVPFISIMQDPRLRNIPRIIETPKGRDLCFDMMNLDVLKALAHE